jgi:hypothetical protein
MTTTARRRWTREIRSEVDGIAIHPQGPVLLHGYDPPAGGMWLDDVIPGKLGALDRNTGETLWLAPCEVGYGRGFGAGFGSENDLVVLGPSAQGHRIVRMSLTDGQLMTAASIEPFDVAVVEQDLCICLTPNRIFGLLTDALTEAWEYSREAERYHHVGRWGDRVFVVFTNTNTGKQGVLCLDASTGVFSHLLLGPVQGVVHELAVGECGLIISTSDILGLLTPEVMHSYLAALSAHDEGATTDTLSLVALGHDHQCGDAPLWHEVLSCSPVDDLPDLRVHGNNNKLYLVRGAWLEVRDMLTGRILGDWTVPGLDESIAWTVCDGAGFLAEETRVSIFELPA